MRRTSILTPLLLALAASCGSSSEVANEYTAAEGATAAGGAEASPPEEQVPLGPLPEGVTPTRYSLWLEVDPRGERFRGRAEIDVEVAEATDRIWMHGRGLNVTEAEVLPGGGEPVPATFEQVHETGVAALRLDAPIEPGEATIVLGYDAPFDEQLKGLYKVSAGGEEYAFTQFEATSARLAFPGFDEPRFKTPFEITLAVPAEHEAIANTAPTGMREIDGMREVRFAETEPLPTYLVAMAVGPLDVVEAEAIPPNDVRERPVPLRGVAARGQGERLAYALEHTGALLADLEEYFGTPYPYDKLDIIAVPDFASGAMENVGAITFREELLLLDPERAPERQRRAFAYVMAHELAHQWFGNLVTMPWWDDIWLNEAFATWMGNKVVREVHPEYNAELSMLRSVHGAMGADSLTSARQIRQPIETNHDIRNAFDAITYRKGGGVLEMFERWMGPETFREGIREHMQRHRFGTATAEDLLDSLSQMAGRDVRTPFNSFLLQPGVPLLSVDVACGDEGNHLTVRQSRYFPVGSEGETDRHWQVPMCVRWGVGRAVEDRCELLEEPEARFDLGERCPDWVMPNADAAGYYRFTLPEEQIERLMSRGWRHLTARERMSLGSNLGAAFDAATLDTAAVFEPFERFAADDTPSVATLPMPYVTFARERLLEEAQIPALERFATDLYGRRARRLGWSPGRREDGETRLFRAELLSFLAETARDARTRREAAERGRRYLGAEERDRDAVDSNLVGLALAMAVQEGDAAFFDRLLARALDSDDALFRSQALRALGSTRDPELGARALALGLDERLRVNEVTLPLTAQLGVAERREAAWEWMRANFDALFGRVATTRAGYAPWYTARFCSEARAEEVEAFFAPRIDALPGGPRNLRGALEAIRLCAARAEAQQASARARFTER